MGQKGRPSKLFTRAEREEALRNGVSYHTLNDRYYRGWSKYDAITTPLRQKPYKYWENVAVQNGIKANTFISRVRRGMSEKDAATIVDLKAERKRQPPPEPQDDTPRKIKAEEGTAPLEVVAQKYNVEPEFVKDVWRYFA